MTSSLVGSEMCIRDREEDESEIAEEPAVAEDGEADSHLPRGTHVVWRSPVSYTHLTLPTICSV
eukprot:10887855-Prorocentrum_lima.AAC.1